MSGLSKLVGAVDEIVDGNGIKHKLSPLDLDDFGQIDVWMSNFVVERAKRIYADAPEDLKARAINAAYITAEHISFADPEGVAILRTPAGTAQLLWHGLRHNDPTITLEATRKMVTANTLKDIQEQLDKLNACYRPSTTPLTTSEPERKPEPNEQGSLTTGEKSSAT